MPDSPDSLPRPEASPAEDPLAGSAAAHGSAAAESSADSSPSDGSPSDGAGAAGDPRTTLRSTTGQSLSELSAGRPVLVAFLRHSGCTFCRELLAELAERRNGIEALGIGIVLVHLEQDADVAELAARYGLADLPRIADPDQRLYAAFELRRMSPVEMLNPGLWLRGFRTAILKRHGFGRIRGDVLQMPGVFLVRDGRILAGYHHDTPASTCDIDGLIAEAGVSAGTGRT